jgi:hypothetical protein
MFLPEICRGGHFGTILANKAIWEHVGHETARTFSRVSIPFVLVSRIGSTEASVTHIRGEAVIIAVEAGPDKHSPRTKGAVAVLSRITGQQSSFFAMIAIAGWPRALCWPRSALCSPMFAGLGAAGVEGIKKRCFVGR